MWISPYSGDYWRFILKNVNGPWVCPPSPRWGKTLIVALSANKKRLFFVHRKIFQLVDPVQHQDVSSKGLLREFCQLQSFQVEIYLFFPPKSPTEIWKLTPQRRHSSELAASVNFFWRRQRRVLSSYIHSTQLSNCIESISWAMFTRRPWF